MPLHIMPLHIMSLPHLVATHHALIATIGHVTELLRSGKNVVLISLDFSKAFDRVRHQTLFEKMDKMDIDDRIFNWMVSYFEDRKHSTKFLDKVSDEENINASVVQGSSMGPASYSVAESDLIAKNDCVKIFKFADYVDMITTTDNYDKIPEELQRIETWADANNPGP